MPHGNPLRPDGGFPAELPPFGPVRHFPFPELHTWTSAEGMTAWLVALPGLPRVACALALRGGSAADDPGREGLGTLLAGALLGGTAGRSAEEVAEAAEATGGELSVAVSEDATYLSITCLARATDRALELLADLVRRPAFPPHEVRRSAERAREEHQRGLAVPHLRGRRALGAALFGAHPYRPRTPGPGLIDAVDPELLRREHACRYTPGAALLVLVGDLDVPHTRRRLTALFGGWDGPAAPEPPPPPTGVGRSLLFLPRPGSVQSLLLLGRTLPPACHPDYLPLLIADAILGESFDSRLLRNLREEKGYAYAIRATVRPLRLASLFEVATQVRTEVTAAALAEIFRELDAMSAPPTASELELARSSRIGVHMLRSLSRGALAHSLAESWVLGRTHEAVAQLGAGLGTVGAGEVARVGGEWLPAAAQSLVVVGEPCLRPELEQLGLATVEG